MNYNTSSLISSGLMRAIALAALLEGVT